MSLLTSIAAAGIFAFSTATAAAPETGDADIESHLQQATHSDEVSNEQARLTAREIDELLTTSSQLPPNCWYEYFFGQCQIICIENGAQALYDCGHFGDTP